MDLAEALLDSWDRAVRILDAVGGLVDEGTRGALPSPDGWPLDHHLAHVHAVRREWLAAVAPERAAALGESFVDGWTTPIADLNEIRSLLAASASAVRETAREGLQRGIVPFGPYENPALFLQHMVWHEGWHVGLLMLGLRLAGREPTEEWEEANVWGEWRTEEPWA